MKNWLDNYTNGIGGLILGFGISFYAYISIILSEICYIWRFLPETALKFSILLVVTCAVICVFGILKRVWVCTKKELITARIYWIVLSILFVAGCFIDFKQNLVLFLLPFIFAFIWSTLRDFQMLRYENSNSRVLRGVSRVFANCLVAIICLVVVPLFPLCVFLYFLNLTVTSKILVLGIAFAYALILPFIIWFEENFVAETIFEIGYEVIWTKNIEKIISDLNISIEVFWCEEFLEAVNDLEEKSAYEPDKAWDEFTKKLKVIQKKLNEENKK